MKDYLAVIKTLFDPFITARSSRQTSILVGKIAIGRAEILKQRLLIVKFTHSSKKVELVEQGSEACTLAIGCKRRLRYK